MSKERKRGSRGSRKEKGGDACQVEEVGRKMKTQRREKEEGVLETRRDRRRRVAEEEHL